MELCNQPATCRDSGFPCIESHLLRATLAGSAAPFAYFIRAPHDKLGHYLVDHCSEYRAQQEDAEEHILKPFLHVCQISRRKTQRRDQKLDPKYTWTVHTPVGESTAGTCGATHSRAGCSKALQTQSHSRRRH